MGGERDPGRGPGRDPALGAGADRSVGADGGPGVTPGAETPDTALCERVEDFLTEAGIEWEVGTRASEYVVVLPGERKLRTVASLVVRRSSLSVVAFVIRHPDENEVEFYQYLLRRNLRMPGLAYAIDSLGDVYLTGSVPAAGVDAAYLDQLLGVLLEAADRPFNDLLAIGFRSSMQKEWDWRVSRGESVRNLEAFRHLLEH